MSLPPALSLFNQFGELSGYKLNLTKCVNVLGVSVTRKYKDLFKENFIILSRWSPLSMPLVGRINSIKMCILPKFLYLFQALPIFIHASFFQQLDSIISSYIWQGKKNVIKQGSASKAQNIWWTSISKLSVLLLGSQPAVSCLLVLLLWQT